jgi:hypothetical protein
MVDAVIVSTARTFAPPCHPGSQRTRSAFEAAWRVSLLKRTEADF